MFRTPNGFNLALTLLGLLGLSGCSKALTESSAVGIAQKWVDRQPHDATFGHLVVDQCGGLLLAIDTVATANCRVHAVLTQAGEAKLVAMRQKNESVIMQATFGKQPDGTWVSTGLSVINKMPWQ